MTTATGSPTAPRVLLVWACWLLLALCGTQAQHHWNSGKCPEELQKDCDADRLNSRQFCEICAGSHQSALHAAGCSDSDISGFCSNETCATQLPAQCDSSRGSCAVCQQCAAKNSLCTSVQRASYCEDSCEDPRERSQACELQLLSSCDHQRREGEMACLTCAGSLSPTLASAKNCTKNMFVDFCGNNSCISSLAGQCSGSTNAHMRECFNCTLCAVASRDNTSCRSADETAYCHAVAPSRAHNPTCDTTMMHYCGGNISSGIIDCSICIGENYDKITRAGCTKDRAENFCKQATEGSLDCMDLVRKLCANFTTTCGKCAECVSALKDVCEC